ncbi:ROK family protein [Clostridium oryzae]|uniref:N-acetylglucosamine repressor n=1 Tax=Clostridium oryzae TaxID=1450648 RepID=A0A1V4ISP1_9CLOT|nr:ROK family protein [Clostridium oryzae]OPJ62936.1 N-acetylglucosamine repressor [Clostridium oryzae]
MVNAYNNIKKLNYRCKSVLDIIQRKGPVTKKTLIDLTKMKLSTLNREVEILINNKLITETDIGESTGGRKPVLYDINHRSFYAVGIDISRTYVKVVITNLKIQIISEKTMYDFKNTSKVIEFITDSLEDMMRELEIDKSQIIGIGIGIVKNFDIDPLLSNLAGKLDVPVFVDNGANAAVIGEYYFGKGKDMNNICYINCGVGVRTGIISSGTLIRTINNAEDAFGHMIVDLDGELCTCGNYGCIEAYVSILNITAKFISEVKKDKKLTLYKELEQVNYRDICEMADKNDEIAANIIKDAAIHFGIGLANFIRLLNPQLVILSGPLIYNSKLFYDISREIALKKIGMLNSDIIFSREGYYENKSIAVGAAVLVLQELKK